MGNLYFGSQKVCPAVQITNAQPVISSLSITPTTSAQTITAPTGTDGYSPISVSAVTSSIDNNIVAGNIKSGVSILGVTGNVTQLVGETRSVSITSTSGNTFTPTSGKNGITSITVTPTNQAKTITPTTSSQSISVPSGYSGFGTLTVDAVTSSIDANITAGNIKNGVSILGITGTLQSGYSELPSYQVSSGVASRRSDALTGTEFSGITFVDDQGLSYAFINCKISGAIDLSNITSIGIAGMQRTFYSCPFITGSIDLSGLTSISNNALDSAFSFCTLITSVDLSNVTSIGSSGLIGAFSSCISLSSINLSSLTTVGNSGLYSTFNSCTSLPSSLDLSTITYVGVSGLYRTFGGCTSLVTVNLGGISTIDSNGLAYAFQGCRYLTDVYFNSLKTTSFENSTNQFSNMMNGTDAYRTHTLHFPSNLQSTISGLTGYPLFGGTSGYVVLAFDLTATS